MGLKDKLKQKKPKPEDTLRALEQSAAARTNSRATGKRSVVKSKRSRKQPKYKAYRGADNPNNPHQALVAARGVDCKLEFTAGKPRTRGGGRSNRRHIRSRWVPGDQMAESRQLRGGVRFSRPAWVRFGTTRAPAAERKDHTNHTAVPKALRGVPRNANRVANRIARQKLRRQRRVQVLLQRRPSKRRFTV